MQSHTQAQSSARLRVAGRFLQCLILLLLPLSAALAPRAATAQAQVQTVYRYDAAGNVRSVTQTPVGSGNLPTLSTSLTFSNVPVGSSGTAQAKLTNASGVAHAVPALNASAVSGDGFSFVSSDCPGTLQDGAFCSITVLFRPALAGDARGSLKVRIASTVLDAALYGKGVVLTSKAVLVGGSPVLPARWLAASAGNSTATVTLRNDGAAPMTLSGLSDLPSRVTVTGNNCTSVAQNGTCQMTLTLHVNGPLSSYGDGPFSVQTVGAQENASFMMTADLYTAISRWETTTLNFGDVPVNSSSQAQVRRVQNVANGTINWKDVPWGGLNANLSPSFTASMGDDCAAVAKNAYCTVTLSFKPTATGAISSGSVAPLNIHSASNYLTVSGNGLAPISKAVLVGGNPVLPARWLAASAGNSTATVTLRNDGAAPMTLSGLSDLPSRVTVTGNNCTSVAQNGTCQMTLTLHVNGPLSSYGDGPFSVQTVGAQENASFMMTADLYTAISRWETTTVSFGDVPVNSSSQAQVRRVQNVANGTINWKDVPWGGLNANLSPSFTASMGDDCAAVAKNAYCTVTLSFKPTATGAISSGSVAPLNIHSASNYLTVSGNGLAPISKAVLVGGSPVLPARWLAASAGNSTATVTLRNDGAAPMTLSGLSDLPSRVTVTGNNCTSVAQNGTCQMTLTLHVNGPLSSYGDGPFSVQTVGAQENASFMMTADLYTAISRWETTTLNFGDVPVNSSSQAQVRRVQNVANGTINWKDVPWGGLNANLSPSFTASMGDDCAAVAKNAYCTVTLSFKPTATGAISSGSVAPLNIHSASNYLTVSGNGVGSLN